MACRSKANSEKRGRSRPVAFRRGVDAPGTLGAIVSLGEGAGATDGVSWGDYSGSVIDGDNLRDLWTIQSITGEDGKGDTVIARVPFADSHK